AVWDAAGGKSVRRFPGHAGIALCVAWLEKGRVVASGGKDATIKFWTVDLTLPARSVKTDAAVHCLLVGPNDRYLICGGINGNLQQLPMPTLDLEVLVQEKPPAEKLSAPDMSAVAEAAKTIRATYQAEYASTKMDEIAGLAERLLERAGAKA